jgi:hypothetical protein
LSSRAEPRSARDEREVRLFDGDSPVGQSKRMSDLLRNGRPRAGMNLHASTYPSPHTKKTH